MLNQHNLLHSLVVSIAICNGTIYYIIPNNVKNGRETLYKTYEYGIRKLYSGNLFGQWLSVQCF